ncbi:hypothetical protein F442_10360 [Phytophthora nicotianae P10297]|uniref:RxLR effector protein n=3 Tax=Phytophthora nicotianae TaxID=4792 RepID=W2R8Q7_PHYN3|nr:hypothetical protein PPTG_01871 [Phytophthora nicotianae INRA-310]ETL38280.1 hypothetical protein L916_10122 [Phytophthora nicotianae]ETP42753.1 hypothetical protein F442_10360 [Phytophthora nicotianae P10297]KUF83844.1 hypothetical protein AM588_10000621 [Phytophthora nicotianae]ETL91396.1 hypothetical protein L917_10051 [Phytophthora nicotianae]ETN21773.1 hypothetical protein PPTG_01871 [Phytophthora nicotianae INRA-310]
MRLPYVLLLAVCIIIASCNALSAYEQEAVVAQNAQRWSSTHSVAAAETGDTSGKRLLRSDSIPTVDAEERALPGMTKLTETLKKWISALRSKLSNKKLWWNYQKLGKQKLSDLDITGMWLKNGKSYDDIFDRWIRLDKSPRQAAKNLLNHGTTTNDLYKVLRKRNMNLETIRPIWREVGLTEYQLRAARHAASAL